MATDPKENPKLPWYEIVKMGKEALMEYATQRSRTQYRGTLEVIFAFLKGIYTETVKTRQLLKQNLEVKKNEP